MEIIESTFLGNTLRQWGSSALVFVLTLIALALMKRYVFKRLIRLAVRSPEDQEELIAILPKRTKSLFLIILSAYLASLVLMLPEETRQMLHTVMIIALLLQIGLWGAALVNFLLERYTRLQMEKDPSQPVNMHLVSLLSKFALWILLGLLILDNIPGVQVTSLITGLGIGGIAIALAVQNILTDLFASLSITLDKPFVIGDNIRVGDMTGTVEHIGLKSTRLRSLDGEQLVFSNNDLLNSRIQNLKRMQQRRIVFTIGVHAATPYEKLEAIPEMVQEIISAHENVTFERAHFTAFGDFALEFEVVYTVDVPDLQTYKDVQQSINLKLYKKFEGEGIVLPYPTQTILLDRNED
jgi:small-conductance mechanosensitive channel